MKITFYIATGFLLLALGFFFFSLMGVVMNMKDKEMMKKQGRNALISLIAAIIFYFFTAHFF